MVEEEVFTRENRRGSAQHATRATPTRSNQGDGDNSAEEMGIIPCLANLRSSTSEDPSVENSACLRCSIGMPSLVSSGNHAGHVRQRESVGEGWGGVEVDDARLQLVHDSCHPAAGGRGCDSGGESVFGS